MKRTVISLAVVMAALSGCGLRPLYGNGGSGAAAVALSSVEVGPVEGRAGWLVRNAIIDRIGKNAAPARYRLDIRLDDQIEGFGIRIDRTTSRERRQLRARYQLIDIAANKTLLDATAGSDMGIDVVNSEYATIAAEQTALERLADAVADQIVARIAVQANRKSGAPGAASGQ
jgi:LPS-assembly lipoprotein